MATKSSDLASADNQISSDHQLVLEAKVIQPATDLASTENQISSEGHLVLEVNVPSSVSSSTILDLETLDKIQRDMEAIKEIMEQTSSLVDDQTPKIVGVAAKIEVIDLSAGKAVDNLKPVHWNAWRCDIL